MNDGIHSTTGHHIHIQTDGEHIEENVNLDGLTLQEAGVILLRLKQIEHQIINKDFQSILEYEK